MLDTNIVQKTVDCVAKAEHVSVGLLDADGYPTASTATIIKRDGIETLWFATGLASNKVRRIRNDARACVCIMAESNNITLVGEMEVMTDPELKRTMWLDWFIHHFPCGVEDPNYCLLRFTTRRASVYIEDQSAEFDIADITTPSSRCGLLCNTCAFKEPYNCGGCIGTDGHPFHGECPVAVCCQDKGFDHCGQCPDVPCTKLNDYSCGDSEHCDKPKGARIEMVKRWAARA